MASRRLTECPVCDAPLAVTELRCGSCDTTLHGDFTTSQCNFCNLAPDQAKFLDLFLRCRGNLREVERNLHLSYPTVRARLDTLLTHLGYPTSKETSDTDDTKE